MCQSCAAHLANDSLAQVCWSYGPHWRIKQGLGGTAGGAWDAAHTGLSYSWHHPRNRLPLSSRSAHAYHGRSFLVPKATTRNLHRDSPSSLPCQQRICLSQPGTCFHSKGQTDLQKHDVFLISCVVSACVGHLKRTLAWRWPEDNFSVILDLLS